MPILNLEDFNIISPSPDNFILRLTIDGKDYNYIGSGEHVYQDYDELKKETYVHKSLITNQLAHSSIFEYDSISTVVTAWDVFDLNDVGVTTDTDDENNDNLLLMQNSNIDPSAKADMPIPMHQINSNSVYGFVSAMTKRSIGVPKTTSNEKSLPMFSLTNHESDPLTRYHYRPMAVALSSVLGLGTQMDFADTFDKLFVFDPTDNNRLSFSKTLVNWRRYQSNRDKSSYRVTNNFDFGKLLVRTILFPKATLNNEYSTERRYTEVSSPYAYMRKYAWDDEHFYSNGSFIVLNSREDNSFTEEIINDIDTKPGTMVTSKYSRRFGDVIAKSNEIYPPGEIILDLSNNTQMTAETDYNVVSDPAINATNSDIFENKSTFKQYMPESINRENETTSDTSLMTSKHKANVFDVDIKQFWSKLKSSIGSIPSEVRDDIKDMIRKNLYEMIENIRPAHTKLYRVITNDDGDDDNDTFSPVGPTPPIEKKVTLTFNANGGYYNNTSTIETRTGKVGDIIETVVTPERLGYLFDDYNPEVPETYPSSNTTYTAQWNPISYTVVFHSNIEDEEQTHEQTFTYGIEQRLDENEFEKEYYEFIGWSRTTSGTVEFQDKAPVLNLATQNVSIDLYAVWNPETYVATFKSNGGTGTMPDQTFTYGIPQKLYKNNFKYDHYGFINWMGSDGNTYDNEQEISLTSNIELSAKWDIIKYYVTFHGNGETSGTMDRQEFIYGEPQELSANKFEKENYIFIEWIGSDDRIYEDCEVVTLTSNLDLFASWQGGALEIQFHGGDGNVEGSMNSQYANYNDSIVLNPNQFTRRHYEFDKWIDANGNKYDDKQRIFNLQNELDLSATWNPTEFEITFNKNDDSATGQMDPVSFTYGDEYARLPRNEFIKEYHEFINWIDISGFEYENEQELSSYDGDGGELSAQWTPSKYYVTFDGNGETSGTMPDQTFTYGIPQALYPNQYTKDNYTFRLWTGNNGRDYIDCEEIELSSNLVLQAQWDRISSTFTFYRTPDQNLIQENPESSPEVTESPSQSGPLLTQSTPPSQQSQITMIYL